MGKLDDGKNAKKPYEKPTVTKLSPEQAKLKRLGHASESHQGAKGLLEMRDSKAKKKSAYISFFLHALHSFTPLGNLRPPCSPTHLAQVHLNVGLFGNAKCPHEEHIYQVSGSP